MRKVILWIVGGLVVVSLTAPVPAQAPRQELVVALGADTYRVDPTRGNVGLTTTNIFDTLVRLRRDYQVEPALAMSWQFVGRNTWRLTLRRGVRFHNGQPFNTAAVKWTFDRIARAGGGTVNVGEESVRVIDDFTVEVTPKVPNVRVIEQIVHPAWGIVAPGTYPGPAIEPANRPTGTGPFRLVEYVRGDHLTVERNDAYWGQKARLSRIVFRFVPDANTRVLALRAGQADVAADVPREVANDLERAPGIRIARAPVGQYEAIYVAIHGKEPYVLGKEKAVRQAIALAINKEAIVRNVWRNNAVVSQTMIPASILGRYARLIRGTPYDPARARQILEEAGWRVGPDGIRTKGGRRLSLVMVVGFPSAEIHRPMPELVQGMLREVGIDVRIVVTPDLAAYEDRLAKGEGDLWVEAGNQNDGNPCFLPDLLFYSRGPEHSDYGALFGPGAAFDRLIEICRTTSDPERLREVAAQAMAFLVDQEFIVIPIAGTFRIWGLRERVQGFYPHPSGVNQRWETVWISP
jgi:peptide/nickel transport system substrate-binding protein